MIPENSNLFKQFDQKRNLYYICCMVVAIVAGLGYTWSIVQTPFVQKLGGTSVTATVALCYTFTVLCSTMSPTILGGLTRHLKINQMILIGGILFGGGYFLTGYINSIPMLFLTYGVGTGVGAGLMYPSIMGYSASVMPEKQGFSSGLMAGVYGGSAIFWSPLLANMIAGSGLTACFNIIGPVCLVLCIAMSFVVKAVPDGYVAYKQSQIAGAGGSDGGTGAKPKSHSVYDMDRGHMVRTSLFYVAAFAFAFGLTSGMMIISQASQILQSGHGMTPTQAALYVSLLSLMSLIGRILWGSVTDKMDKYVTLCIICAIPILTMGILTVVTSTGVVIACMAITALCYGGFGGTITPITADLFGTGHITENYGVMYLMFGIAALIGPRVAVTMSHNGDYSKAFLIGCILAVISLAAAFVIRRKVASAQS